VAHLVAVFEGNGVVKAATEKAPFGPGFSKEEAETATRMEVHGSSFNDSGADWTEFRLIGAKGNVFKKRRVGGY